MAVSRTNITTPSRVKKMLPSALFIATFIFLGTYSAIAGVSGRSHSHSSSSHSSGGHCHSTSRYHGSSHSVNYYRRCNTYHRNGEFRSNGFSLGMGMPYMDANITQHYHQDQPDVLINGMWMTDPNAAPLDATINRHIRSTCTMSFNIGYSLPVLKLNSSSQLAIEALAAVDFYHWNVGTVHYTENTSAFDSAYSQNYNIPISLNYVFGGQADGHSGFTCTIGAGEAISITNSKYINHETRVGYRPFVMAEVGVLAGIPVKLRATAYLGNIILIDKPTGTLYDAQQADGNIDGNLGVKMTGSSGFNVSLILMPGFHSRW